MAELRRDISWVARSGAPVLITGETAVATAVARRIHAQSSRARGPYITWPCAHSDPLDISGSHHAGAAMLALADSGTIFLDGIECLPIAMQHWLFRFLHTRDAVGPVAGAAGRVDVRVLAATSCDLREMIARSAFDEALYYRLNVIHLRVPSASAAARRDRGIAHGLRA